jgi:PPM family protein phosphatase
LTTEPQKPQTAAAKSWFIAASATHVGMRRKNNQDSHVVLLSSDQAGWEKYGHLLVVADGMGAHAAGELASQMAVEQIPLHYQKLQRGSHADALAQALTETNSEIYRRGQANPVFRSMGTTTCALAVVPEGAIIAHVGDSRVYRLRGSVFEQLTFDHSLVWEMRAAGDISEEAIKNSTIPKNVITRSLGPNANVAVDIEGPFPLQVGDRFLLCSDGLSGQLSDEEIGTLLMLLDIETAVQAMVDLANLRGGPDNITVVIGEVRSLEGVVKDPNTLPSFDFSNKSYPIGFGVVAAFCGLLAIILWVLGYMPLAFVSLGASAVAFATGWFKYRTELNRVASVHGSGKSPYRQYRCKPDLAFTQNLSGVVEELEAWFRDNQWTVPEGKLRELMSQARKAEQSRSYADAIRAHISVILQLMKLAGENQKSEHTTDEVSRSEDPDGSIEY